MGITQSFASDGNFFGIDFLRTLFAEQTFVLAPKISKRLFSILFGKHTLGKTQRTGSQTNITHRRAINVKPGAGVVSIRFSPLLKKADPILTVFGRTGKAHDNRFTHFV
ncbi:MAG: hypothetical protein HOF22_04620 [Verrucomicrobia bacterium]|nr:hypothetical protein [Verrucomicrobiota bacterium]